MSSPLTRYYAGSGTPPGRWLGSALRGLAGGSLAVGDEVSEDHLRLLVGSGRDPVTEEPLGRPYRAFASVQERIAIRAAKSKLDLPESDHAAQPDDEASRDVRRAVAGFDFTISVPKSASVLWALGGPWIRDAVEVAHRSAVEDVVAFLEREVVSTRMGASDGSGAVLQADVTGVVATAFDHFDSRAGDPHLHTHMVIANKVQTVVDGRWRALDGRPLHAAAVAISELHEALFADRITALLGVDWEERTQGRNRNPSWAIGAVSDDLLREFSSRSRDIDRAADQLVGEYREVHGHSPSPAVVMRLRAQATLQTRPEKQVRPLDELRASWRERASTIVGEDVSIWAARAGRGMPARFLRSTEIPEDVLAEVGERVVAAVGEKRSTWTHWNLVAETARQTMGWRFATPADREHLIATVVTAAERVSVQLTPSDFASTPEAFRRADGSSRFRPRYTTRYTSEALLEAERRLVNASRDQSGPSVPAVLVETVLAKFSRAQSRLGTDQRAAVDEVVGSGRVLDLLIGPAGAGKTTTMRTVRHVWESAHGPDSVIGLAPSAAAAEVLGADLGIPTENTAKWLHERLAAAGEPSRPSRLIIVDEASLAGTRSLDAITTLVAGEGGKVLLVGDQAQLQAVDAGGALALLAADRDDVAELTDVHRFTAGWEKAASLQLRRGDSASLASYRQHGRIHGGDIAAVLDAAFDAWRSDQAAGRVSLLIADGTDTVASLNRKARAHRILVGAVDPAGAVRLHDGSEASAGDAVITRRNDRRLMAGRRWVRNGDRWTVLRITSAGDLIVRRAGRRWGSTIRLLADYVANQVELGYAVTTHRAQGATVDTAHSIVSAASSREAVYVGLTRGRHANTAWVALDQPDVAHTPPPDDPAADTETAAVEILTSVLSRVGAERSAHATLRAEQDAAASIRVLAAQYDTIASHAQAYRWTVLITDALPPDQATTVTGSAAFGPLCRALRRIEAYGQDPAAVLRRVVAVRSLDDADDLAAVLHARLTRATPSRPGADGRLIAGLIPHAAGAMADDLRVALEEREQLIEARASALAEVAIRNRPTWVRDLGPRPEEPHAGHMWDQRVRLVAAHRDLHNIAVDTSLGESMRTPDRHDAVDPALDRLRLPQASTSVSRPPRVTATQRLAR